MTLRAVKPKHDDPFDLRASLETLTGQLAEDWRQQLTALRTALDERLTASQDALASASYTALVDPILEAASHAAAEQAERARQDTQTAADAKLATVQAEFRAQHEAEAAANGMLRETLDDTRKQLDTARSSIAALDAARTALEAQLRDAVAESQTVTHALAESRTQMEAARHEAKTTAEQLASAQHQIKTLTTEQESRDRRIQELDSAKAAIEAQYHEVVAASQKLTDALTQMETQLDTLRHERDTAAASLAKIERQLETQSAEHTLLRQQKQDALAKLEQESLQRSAMTETVEDARETAKQAKAETKALLKATVEHVRAITESFALIRDGLRSFDAAHSTADVWKNLVKQMGHSFARAAVFFGNDNMLELAETCGVDATAAKKAAKVPMSGESSVARAFRDKATMTVPSAAVGLFGQACEHSVAVPLMEAGRVIGVIYGEQPHISGADAAKTTAMIAEALAAHAGTCAGAIASHAHALAAAARETARPAAHPPAGKKSSAEGAGAPPQKKPIQFPGPARDAQRVVIRRGTQIMLDGAPGELADLSIGGAQVVLTQSVRPNQLVRLSLPIEGGQVACKGRVVWAVFEQSRTSMAMYRAGIKFSEADRESIESFMNDYGELPTMLKQHTSGVA